MEGTLLPYDITTIVELEAHTQGRHRRQVTRASVLMSKGHTMGEHQRSGERVETKKCPYHLDNPGSWTSAYSDKHQCSLMDITRRWTVFRSMSATRFTFIAHLILLLQCRPRILQDQSQQRNHRICGGLHSVGHKILSRAKYRTVAKVSGDQDRKICSREWCSIWGKQNCAYPLHKDGVQVVRSTVSR